MRRHATRSILYRFFVGVMMICGLLLLPPSSAHADSGMHGDAHASHHASHAMTVEVPPELPMEMASPSTKGEVPDSFEGDPCCGGICLTAALSLPQDVTVTVIQSKRFTHISRVFLSAETWGELRPPRA